VRPVRTPRLWQTFQEPPGPNCRGRGMDLHDHFPLAPTAFSGAMLQTVYQKWVRSPYCNPCRSCFYRKSGKTVPAWASPVGLWLPFASFASSRRGCPGALGPVGQGSPGGPGLCRRVGAARRGPRRGPRRGRHVGPSAVRALKRKIYARIPEWPNRPLAGDRPYLRLDGGCSRRVEQAAR
jgi:hypothetical protein